MKRIAVWNTAFLGDAVLTLPLLQSLRLRYPEAAIDYYVRGGLEPLFSAHPAITAVYGYAKRVGQGGASGFIGLARGIASRRYDLWLSAHTSPRSGFFALSSRAPIRIGYRSPALNRLFYTDRVDRRFMELDEIERLLELLRPLGPGPSCDWPELILDTAAREAAEAFFAPLQGSPVLGLHPGSVWGTKRWPAAHFSDIGAKALKAGAQVLVFAGPGEEETARAVLQGIGASGPEQKARLHDLSGGLSLPLLAAYLARLSCYLTNDSGPMHLAWVQGTPVIALFGPTVRRLGFFPRGPRATALEIPLNCRPCGLHGPSVCPLGHHRCMLDLTPNMVWPHVSGRLWPHAGNQGHVI